MRFQSVRSHSPGMMLSPAAYSPYAQSQFCASPATFNQTPIASPMQSEFNHSDSYPYFNSPHLSATSDGFQSTYASPLLLQQQHSTEYYGHSPLVSPPITPMDGSSSFAHQMSSTPVKIEVHDRSFEYPMSPYTPTYANHPHHLKWEESDNSRRPVSAGRLMAQRDIYSNGIAINHPLKRAHSFNSTRFAKSLSPPRSVSSSSQNGSKRPTYSKWSADEDDMLRTAIAIHGTSKWSLVASMVKGRTAMQCSTRWQGALNTTIHKGKWEAEEDRILVTAVEKWREEHPPQSPGYDSDDDEQAETIPWGMIATMLPRRRTGIQCQARWSEALDPTVRKGKWTPEEDEMLFKGVAEHGQCWIKVASRVRGRTQRQIRTRWMQIRGRDKGVKV
jgi:nuclear transport factor 2 (NTF2) superfamily protein